jgi:hypothetical protein
LQPHALAVKRDAGVATPARQFFVLLNYYSTQQWVLFSCPKGGDSVEIVIRITPKELAALLEEARLNKSADKIAAKLAEELHQSAVNYGGSFQDIH